MQSHQHNYAIGYGRISIKDQSTYSLLYQEKSIREYCAHNNLELLAFFRDNGECSDTFDRPDWKALEVFIQQHKGLVNYLIITEHDRFSRKLIEALQKIEQLQKKYNVKVVSIFEPITIDNSDPNVFFQRVIKLALANQELYNIRNRTAAGIREARASGRFANKAPFGYINKRDRNDLPIIVIDVRKAEVVKQIFRDFLAGVPYKLLQEVVKRAGFSFKGHSRLTALLTNPTYAGLVKVPAGNGQPARIIKGLHKPIISEATYHAAVKKVANKSPHHFTPRQDIPLRGILHCKCGASISGSFSKGKSKRYLYYFCAKERSKNFSGNYLHDIFSKMLSSISFSEKLLDTIKELVKEWHRKLEQERTLKLQHARSELNELIAKINSLEAAFIIGILAPNVYKKHNESLILRKTVLQAEVQNILDQSFPDWNYFNAAQPFLHDLNTFFSQLDLAGKQKLAKLIFTAGIEFTNPQFIVPCIHPAFKPIYNHMKSKSSLILK